jgi:uncharacterized membrane protein
MKVLNQNKMEKKELLTIYTILVVIAIFLFGFLNTIYLSNRIQILEDKIESLIPFKSELNKQLKIKK